VILLSGLSLLSAIITLFWVKPMTHDGLIEEDQAVSDGDFVQRFNAQAGFGPQVPSIPAEEWL